MMPHIIVKMYKGRTEEQKRRLAAEMERVLIETVNCSPDHISLDIQEYDPAQWEEKVASTEVTPYLDRLYIKPGQ